MIDSRCERYLRRLERIVVRKMNVQKIHPSTVWRVGRTHYRCLPMKQVFCNLDDERFKIKVRHREREEEARSIIRTKRKSECEHLGKYKDQPCILPHITKAPSEVHMV
jgi:hypothetical protein